MSKKPRRGGPNTKPGETDLPPRHLHVHPECGNVIEQLKGKEVLDALRRTYQALSGLDNGALARFTYGLLARIIL